MVKELIISGEVLKVDAEILSQIKKLGMNYNLLQLCDFLPHSVASHPDMCMYYTSKGEWIAHKNAYDLLKSIDTDAMVSLSDQESENITKIQHNCEEIKYPNDASLDCLRMGKQMFCGKGTDKKVLETETTSGCEIIFTKQGYVKCSVCVVGKDALITEDCGLAKQFEEHGFDVLLLKKREVVLPGYNCGFIGGASFKFANDGLAFFGDVKKHSEYENIKSFCASHGVFCEALSESVLTDFGGAMCIK